MGHSAVGLLVVGGCVCQEFSKLALGGGAASTISPNQQFVGSDALLPMVSNKLLSAPTTKPVAQDSSQFQNS